MRLIGFSNRINQVWEFQGATEASRRKCYLCYLGPQIFYLAINVLWRYWDQFWNILPSVLLNIELQWKLHLKSFESPFIKSLQAQETSSPAGLTLSEGTSRTSSSCCPSQWGRAACQMEIFPLQTYLDVCLHRSSAAVRLPLTQRCLVWWVERRFKGLQHVKDSDWEPPVRQCHLHL